MKILIISVSLLLLTGLYIYSVNQTSLVDDNDLQAYDLHLIQNDEARCLDGSKPGFYFAKGSGTGADKFLIYFQGGGWIVGKTQVEVLDDAVSRSNSDLGSSTKWPVSKHFPSSFLSRNATFNPHFYNWNSVQINYCDGTGHEGFRKNSIIHNGKELFFRGERNTKLMLEALKTKFGFGETKHVLVSGSSAGGLAVFTWANYIRDLFPASVRVIAAPDSGFHLDMDPFNKDPASAWRNMRVQQRFSIVNQEIDPINQDCVKANLNEKWKCQISQYLVNYVKVPMFIMSSLYDKLLVPHILMIECIKNGSLNGCSADEKQYIEQYHSNLQNHLVQITKKNTTWGAWAVSCSYHSFLEADAFNSQYYRVPYQSEITVEKALGDWVHQRTLQNNVHIDQATWPNNEACRVLH